jgi:hypothetical protein
VPSKVSSEAALASLSLTLETAANAVSFMNHPRRSELERNLEMRAEQAKYSSLEKSISELVRAVTDVRIDINAIGQKMYDWCPLNIDMQHASSIFI